MYITVVIGFWRWIDNYLQGMEVRGRMTPATGNVAAAAATALSNRRYNNEEVR